jgi:hypothetical protein
MTLPNHSDSMMFLSCTSYQDLCTLLRLHDLVYHYSLIPWLVGLLFGIRYHLPSTSSPIGHYIMCIFIMCLGNHINNRNELGVPP